MNNRQIRRAGSLRHRLFAGLACPAIIPAIIIATVGTAFAEPAPVSRADISRSAAAQDDARIASLLAHMSVEHKVAQLIEPDIGSITPEDMRRYRFGTIVNGGNSGPGGNDNAAAPAWLALADAMYRAGTEPLPGGEPVIPPLWGIDAVHGDNNIPGATLFPHNVGLGAANDAALVRRIGQATAQEVAATGIDWAYAPTLAVSTDVRWGRSYESYSENPALVARLGVAMIEGLQGTLGTADFLDQRHVLATAKHFFADGGTGGVDQGDTRGDINAIIATHAAPYPPAIAAGVQTIMASFSSINGTKMHGNAAMLTGFLRGRLGFDGLLVGDWNAHGQVPGCSNSDCPAALMAGLDVFMVPSDWRALYDNTLAEVRAGTIPMARIDEAVGRVLRVKLHDHLFDKPAPAGRELAGQWALLGSPEHRAIAREAVARSLVLLKNDGVLPIRNSAHILVAGTAADSVARSAGGWTISWQGGGTLTNRDFPGATSIYGGIAAAARGGAVLSADGTYTHRPDVAVVVFGEQPYAEFVGDRPDFALHDEEGLRLLRTFKAQHIPTVAVLLSGRPMWVNRELASADAFVAAWLPGSEGEGVADVLIGDAKGHPRTDFTGRLGFHWPSLCDHNDHALFAVGYGGSYAQRPARLPALDQTCAALHRDDTGVFPVFNRRLAEGVTVSAREGTDIVPLPGMIGVGPHGALRAVGLDYFAQEDARELTWTGPAELRLAWPVARMAAFAKPASGEVVLRYSVNQMPHDPVHLRGDCADCGTGVDLGPTLAANAGKGWQTAHIPLSCLGGAAIGGLALKADGALFLRLATVELRPGGQARGCTGAM